MSAGERPGSLTPLARLGFSGLTEAEELLQELAGLVDESRELLLEGAVHAADPDEALAKIFALSTPADFRRVWIGGAEVTRARAPRHTPAG